MKNTITKVKNLVETYNSRLKHKEEINNTLEVKHLKFSKEAKGIKKSEEGLWELQNTLKRNNVYIMGIPELEEKKERTESTFEAIIAEYILKVGREMDTQIHGKERTSDRLNSYGVTPRYVIIKLSKVKEK